MKVCLLHLGLMIKMAAMPIYVKPSSELKGQWPWGLVCSIGDMGPPKFENNDSYRQNFSKSSCLKLGGPGF